LFEYKFDCFFFTVWGPKSSKKIKTSHLFYVSYFKFWYNYFLKFVVYKINSKMVKYEMVVVTEIENIDVIDADVVVS
jgi:hypothetical protein